VSHNVLLIRRCCTGASNLTAVFAVLQLFYGQNLDHAGQGGAVLRVGASVQVLAAGAPFLRK
jgi:hypothetical protein